MWNASFGGWFGHIGRLSMGGSAIVELCPENKTAYIILRHKPTSIIYQGHEIYGLVKQKVNGFVD